MSARHGPADFRPNVWSRYAILTASMLIIMGAAAVAPALNGIEEEFGAGKLMTSLVVTLPALAVACFGFPMGAMADRLGMRFTLILSLVLFTVFGVAGYFATSIGTLLVTRFIVGIGIAGVATSDNALITLYYRGPERAKIITQQSVFMGIGVIVLELAGGLLADIDWKSPFLVYAIGVPILILAVMGIYDMAPAEQGPALEERKVNRRKAKIGICYVSIFMVMFCLYIVTVNMSDYLADMGEDMTLCGCILALLGAMNSLVPFVMNRMGRRPPLWKALLTAFLLQAVCLLLLVPSDIILTVIAALCIGIGMGIATPSLVGSMSGLAPRGKEGVVMGAYSVFMNLGSFTSALVVGAIIEDFGFSDAFLWIGVFMICFAAVLATVARSVFRD